MPLSVGKMPPSVGTPYLFGEVLVLYFLLNHLMGKKYAMSMGFLFTSLL
jgi:hypothetical protein